MRDPTRICVLGDSHTAAVLMGWRIAGPEFPHVEPSYFTGVKTEWDNLNVEDGGLVAGSQALREMFARRSAGQDRIEGGYDGYIICSLGLRISRPLRLWTEQGIRDPDAHRRAVRAFVEGTPCARVLAKLRQITSRPAIVLSAPFQPVGYCKSSPVLDPDTAGRLRAVFNEACDAMTGAHGAAFWRQPAATLAENQVTSRMEFARTSAHGEREDRYHCNAAYGAIVVRDILSAWPPGGEDEPSD